MIRVRTITILALLLMIACVEPYFPPSQNEDLNMLVIDGFLNGAAGTATVKLTRAVPLSVSVANPPESGATVSIENEEGDTFPLPEAIEGNYEADNLAIDPSLEYRLRIETASGKSYTSDYVVMKRAPSLDSVTWRPEATGTRFYVNAHDPSHQTTYYRFLFTETWEYNVPYFSYFKKVDGYPVLRDLTTEQIYTCWKSGINTEILTVSTKSLARDEVSMFPINFVKKGSRQLSHIYSLLVQERAITQEEYEYWALIRKTTETLGGLFDPLPSEVTGNIHNNDDPTERVLGYFSGGIVQEKRIFVRSSDLPPDLKKVDAWDFVCEQKKIPYSLPEQAGGDVFLSTSGIPPTQWIIAIPNCSDCRTLGGVNVKPGYWPN